MEVTTRFKFESKLLVAFITAMLVIALLAGTAWKVLRDADEASRRVARTTAVLEGIAPVREATILIESLTRGYIISGDKRPLAERVEVAVRRVDAIRRIQTWTTDNLSHQARCCGWTK